MKRYAIMVRENYPGAKITELCRCNTNPQALARAAELQTTLLTSPAFYKMPKYNYVEIIDLAHAVDESTNEIPG